MLHSGREDLNRSARVLSRQFSTHFTGTLLTSVRDTDALSGVASGPLVTASALLRPTLFSAEQLAPSVLDRVRDLAVHEAIPQGRNQAPWAWLR